MQQLLLLSRKEAASARGLSLSSVQSPRTCNQAPQLGARDGDA